MESLHPVLNFSISFCDSSMLAYVLGPRLHNEGLYEATLVSRVAKEVPVESPVASFDLNVASNIGTWMEDVGEAWLMTSAELICRR